MPALLPEMVAAAASVVFFKISIGLGVLREPLCQPLLRPWPPSPGTPGVARRPHCGGGRRSHFYAPKGFHWDTTLTIVMTLQPLPQVWRSAPIAAKGAAATFNAPKGS